MVPISVLGDILETELEQRFSTFLLPEPQYFS
jgi:hypothetical protein